MRVERQGIIIWFQNRRNIKQIKRFGHLIYASRKLNYAVLYVNQEDIEEVEGRLNKYSFVKKMTRSQKPFIRTNFETIKDELKEEQNYHMGI